MNHENIVSEFNRGLKSLQAAQILLKEGLYEDAVSRGYYAVRRSLAANLGGQDWKNRSFKVVEINDHTGEIVGMTHRSLTTSN